MKSIAERVLSLLPVTVEYAEVRVVRRRHEGLHVENEAVGQVLLAESEGLAVRVLCGGQWGFAATARLDPGGFERALASALAQARAADGAGPRVRLAPAPVVRDVYRTHLVPDPFAVPIDP